MTVHLSFGGQSWFTLVTAFLLLITLTLSRSFSKRLYLVIIYMITVEGIGWCG